MKNSGFKNNNSSVMSSTELAYFDTINSKVIQNSKLPIDSLWNDSLNPSDQTSDKPVEITPPSQTRIEFRFSKIHSLPDSCTRLTY
jgi:hypothetical protein